VPAVSFRSWRKKWATWTFVVCAGHLDDVIRALGLRSDVIDDVIGCLAYHTFRYQLDYMEAQKRQHHSNFRHANCDRL